MRTPHTVLVGAAWVGLVACADQEAPSLGASASPMPAVSPENEREAPSPSGPPRRTAPRADASSLPEAPPPVEPQALKAGETDEHLELRLVAHARRPAGFRRAPRTPGPRCISEEEGSHAGLTMTIRSRGRTLDVGLDPGLTGLLEVREGKAVLWSENVGSAAGAYATGACSHDGWGVIIAGHYRHGDDVFNLFTGKKLGPGDVAVYAPDLSFALVPPAFWFGADCYRWSRTFRVPTDGSARPFPLATPPVPGDWTCDSVVKQSDQRPESDRPSVAISSDSARYAIASPQELSVYRASDDKLVARYLRPPYRGADRADSMELAFSANGDALVLSTEGGVDGRGIKTPAAARWFTIERR